LAIICRAHSSCGGRGAAAAPPDPRVSPVQAHRIRASRAASQRAECPGARHGGVHASQEGPARLDHKQCPHQLHNVHPTTGNNANVLRLAAAGCTLRVQGVSSPRTSQGLIPCVYSISTWSLNSFRYLQPDDAATGRATTEAAAWNYFRILVTFYSTCCHDRLGLDWMVAASKCCTCSAAAAAACSNLTARGHDSARTQLTTLLTHFLFRFTHAFAIQSSSRGDLR
jgi:hypothetical protein